MQIGSFALFVGREDLLALSFNYSVMNLRGFMYLAALGERVGVDLWKYRTDDGRSIRAALDFLVPFARGEQEWEHRQIRPISYSGMIPLLRRAG